MIDLWPEQLEDTEIRSPVSILREQATLLGSKTNNLVQADVEIGNTATGNFLYHFFIVAPTLNNYHYRLFSVEHDIALYPSLIYVGEELGQELGAQPKSQLAVEKAADRLQSMVWANSILPRATVDYYLSVNSEDEFVNTLKLILNSNVTKQVISALLSQISVRETNVLSPW
jgi:hypothetical protein